MTRILRFFALFVALVGLSAPSATLGMTVSAVIAPVELAETSAMPVARIFGCKALGGKRVLPCHPDQGVLAAAIVPNPPLAGPVPLPRDLPPAAMDGPETELPPPRAS